MKRIQFVVLLLLATMGMKAGPSELARDEVTFTALPKAKTVNAGVTFEVELKYKITPGWHIGPSKSKKSIPTEVEWTLPKGVKVTDVKWPELNYFGNPPGYQGVIIVTAKLQAGNSVKPGNKLTLGVKSS